MDEGEPRQPAPPAWLVAADEAGLAPEELGARRIVDALGLVLASGGGPEKARIGLLAAVSAPDLVCLDYGLTPADPATGLRMLVTGEAVELRVPVVAWQGERPIVRSALLERHAWRGLSRVELATLLRAGLASVRMVRRTCTACGKRVPLGRYLKRASRVVCFACDQGAPA